MKDSELIKELKKLISRWKSDHRGRHYPVHGYLTCAEDLAEILKAAKP